MSLQLRSACAPLLGCALLALTSSLAFAKPAPHASGYSFSGDRYVRVAQGGSALDVTRAMRCPPPACHRGARDAKHHYRTRHKRRLAPGTVAPLSLPAGFRREVRTAAVTILGGRPAGCPHRFCGCGASLHLFGRIIPTLNLAANWLRFPRAAPGPNMVAARPGHVFVLKQHIAGNMWLVFDANSGGHRTRIHPRSIAGFAIVNPRGRA